MPAKRTHTPAFATITPRSCGLDVRRISHRAAELARAVDSAEATAAVESLIKVALSQRPGPGWGAPWEWRTSWESWANVDAWSGGSLTASPAIASPRSFTMFGIREERPGP